VTALLFDLDRTLIDVQSYTDYRAAFDDVEALIGRWDDPPTPPTGWDGPTRQGRGVLVALSGDHRWEAVSRLIEQHELVGVVRSRAMPGLEEALRLVRAQRCAVVTLLPDTAARAALRMHGTPFDIVAPRRPDLRPKPAPDQLVAACTLLGVEPVEAVMIGDSTWDELAAAAAGCRFIGVTNGRPSEFGAETLVESELAAAVASALAP
jgi:HAD superfamily hydrolase (TIGR01509 family)